MDYHRFIEVYYDSIVADFYYPETRHNVCVVATDSGLLLECVFQEEAWLYFDIYRGE